MTQITDLRWSFGAAMVLIALTIAALSQPVVAQSGVVLPGLKGNDLTDPEDDGTLEASVVAGGENSPGEVAANLIDSDADTKWLTFSPFDPGETTVDIMFNGGAQFPVTAYTLTSANDAPDRDPTVFTVSGTNNGVDFTPLETRTGTSWNARFQTRVFFLDNATSFNRYRFEFDEINGSGCCIQLAEIELFETFAFEQLITTINRDTGEIRLINDNSAPINIAGYSYTSASGALNSDNWTTIAGNTDGSTGGDGTVDDDEWHRFTEAGARGDLSEAGAASGDGATLAANQEVSLGNAWLRSPGEDVVLNVLLDDNTVISPPIIYEGNGGFSFARGDLTFDGNIDVADWNAFKNGQGADFSSIISTVESYGLGDLDADFDHDLDDFNAFRGLFDAANGVGAFSAMVAAVPEPSGVALATLGLLFGLTASRRRQVGVKAAVLLLMAFVVTSCTSRSAIAGIELGQNAGGSSFLIGNDLTDAGDDGTLDVTITTNGSEPGAEGPEKALDNDGAGTKWLNFSPNGTFYQVQFEGGAQHAVNSYTITSGNDAPERDAYSWTLNGSNDGVNFSVVDSQAAQEWSDRNVTQQFFVGNTQAFNYYRFDFLTELGAGGPNPGGPNSIQINEIELLNLANPDILRLQVNTDTGAVSIHNSSSSPIDLNAYRITSAAGSLSSSGWNSLAAQDGAGFPAGDGSGNGWEVGPNADANELVEWYLTDDSTLSSGASLQIGNAFAPSAIDGDFDTDDDVDGGDFLEWQRTLADSTSLNDWESNFGFAAGAGVQDLTFRYTNSSGNDVFGFVEYVSSPLVQAVPEPSSSTLAVLLLASLAGMNRIRFRRTQKGEAMNTTSRLASMSGVFVLSIAFFANSTVMASTPDRDYQFGDDLDENGSAGAVVGSANGVAPNTTLDSQGPTGSFIDLTQNNGPTYVDVDALGRPFATSGELGIQFDGSDDFLRGIGVGNPGQGDEGQTVVYDGLFQRTIQGYVRPTNAAAGARQDVFFDTAQFGIFITDTNNWGVEYGQPGTFSTTIPVAFNDWTHVMHRTTGGVVVLYLDGVASFLRGGFYNANPGGDDADMWVGSGIGGASEFFTGQLDDFQVLISGDNSDTAGGADYGAFNLGLDNDFVRETLAVGGFVEGDVNGDGLVNGDGSGDPANDDVTFFIDHWLDQQVVDGFAIGDINTRTTMADLNFSGTTNLFDWAILRTNHANGGALDLGALLAARAVPEPGTLGLAGIALVAGALTRRRRC